MLEVKTIGDTAGLVWNFLRTNGESADKNFRQKSPFLRTVRGQKKRRVTTGIILISVF